MVEINQRINLDTSKHELEDRYDRKQQLFLALQAKVSQLEHFIMARKRSNHFDQKQDILIEFVKGIHCFLAIATAENWLELMYLYEDDLHDLVTGEFKEGLRGSFIEVQEDLAKCMSSKDKEQNFKRAWFNYIVCIGIIGLGLSFAEMENTIPT